MKRIILFFILFLYLYSCDKRLEIKPLNILTVDQIIDDESALKAYLASLYSSLPSEDHLFTGEDAILMNSTDESVNLIWRGISGVPDGTWEYLDWWGYDNIRNVNSFADVLTESNLDENEKNVLLGEIKFIRAFYYFALVKRYGGVPIVRDVQEYSGGNLEQLKIPRDSEEEVWDFISDELDEAIELLPTVNESGRATKYAAYALKSRAMLYAGTIAKYGTTDLDGIIGIPADRAEKYWEQVINASQEIIESDNFSLYDKNPNRIDNYTELFIDEDNPESIFTVYYKYPEKAHSYEVWYLPFGVRSPLGYGSQMAPTLQIVEQFEYIDGSSGELKIINEDGSPVFYKNPLDLFQDKDPRCLASVIVPFAMWQDKVIDVQAGIYDQGVKHEASSYDALYNPTTHKPDNDNGTLHIVGKNGFGAGSDEITFTGFYVRKYLDFTKEQSRAVMNASDQQFIVFRFAEVLLNFAEAAAELGDYESALSTLNSIRNRAGISELSRSEVSIEKIRHERLVELAFENHRWWDYIRWRKSDEILNNFNAFALKPYYDITNDSYRFEIAPAKSQTSPKNFNTRAYYQRIPVDEIRKNNNLIQNPGY